MRGSLAAGASVAVAATVALAAATAAAHEVGLSRGDYVVEGREVRSRLVFARRELAGLVAGLDADHDGVLTEAELAASRDAVEGALVGRIRVQGDGAPCPGTLDRVELAEQDGVAVLGVHPCPRRPRRLAVELAFFTDLSEGHRHLARATAGPSAIDAILSRRTPSFSLDVPDAPDSPALPAAPSTRPPWQRGVLLVLARPWAPAFLLAIFATCASRRAALLAAAAFTAAAALGFGLGAGGLFLPGPRALAVAVALSLAYAGIEAVVSPDGARPGGFGGQQPPLVHCATAAPFGLVHGIAWSAAIPAGSRPAALAGVALALSASTAILLPAAPWSFAPRGRAILGAAVAAAGAAGVILTLA
jgi:hypothetical protein